MFNNYARWAVWFVIEVAGRPLFIWKNRTFWKESAFVNDENLNKSIEMMKLQTFCGVQT